MSEGRRPYSSKEVFWRLVALLVPYRMPLTVCFGLLLITVPGHLVQPLIWKFIVDRVIVENQPHLLWPATVVMIAVAAFTFGLGAFRTYLLEKTGERLVVDLRQRVYEKLQAQSLAYHHHHRLGDLISRTMGDVDALRDAVIRGLDTVISNAMQFALVAGIIVSLQPWLGLSVLAPMALVFVLMRVFNQHVRAIYRQVRERVGDVSAKLQENLGGITVIKAFAREDFESRRFRAVNEDYRKIAFRAAKARAFFFPSTVFIGFMSSIIMIGGGAWMVIRGQFTLGGLVAYSRYWWQLFSPIDTLATVNELFQRAIASASRVFELLDAHEQVADPETPELLLAVRGDIEFRHVSFAYEKQTVLHDIHLRIPAGQTVAFVGPSGGGKSTLLNLVLRFYDPTTGAIFLDGHDLRNLAQRELRKHISVVLQETFLFGGSIRENIRFGRPEASDADIEVAARAANAHDFIAALPLGYDTLVGERGVKLSGGQRQRIAIARAFLADPQILILDEATSAVEPESEWIIQQALEKLMRGRTTLLTSHRFSMMRGADRIISLLNGRIVEDDSHEKLLQRNGVYAAMFRLQMGQLAEEQV